jgi:hypothetical protein
MRCVLLVAVACLGVGACGADDDRRPGSTKPSPECRARSSIEVWAVDSDATTDGSINENLILWDAKPSVRVEGEVNPASASVSIQKRVRHGETSDDKNVRHYRTVRVDRHGEFSLRLSNRGLRSIDDTVDYRFDLSCAGSQKPVRSIVVSLTAEHQAP